MTTELLVDDLIRKKDISWLDNVSTSEYFVIVNGLSDYHKSLLDERQLLVQRAIRSIETNDISWLDYLSHNDYFAIVDGLSEYYQKMLRKKQMSSCFSVSEYQYITYDWRCEDLRDIEEHEQEFRDNEECIKRDYDNEYEIDVETESIVTEQDRIKKRVL